jgi:DNA-binding MarR family transcriptional regulator
VRSRIVHLTDAGRALRARAEGIPAAILADLQMNIDELAALRDTLNALTERVEQRSGQS